MAKLRNAGFTLLAVLCIGMVYGCSGEDSSPNKNRELLEYPHELGTHEGLSAATEWRILQDFFNQVVKHDLSYEGVTLNDLIVFKFIGKYTNSFVVEVVPYDGMASTPGGRYPIFIADVVFCCHYSPRRIVWNDRRFYTLQEAYSIGLLTQDDLQIISDRITPAGLMDN